MENDQRSILSIATDIHALRECFEKKMEEQSADNERLSNELDRLRVELDRSHEVRKRFYDENKQLTQQLTQARRDLKERTDQIPLERLLRQVLDLGIEEGYTPSALVILRQRECSSGLELHIQATGLGNQVANAPRLDLGLERLLDAARRAAMAQHSRLGKMLGIEPPPPPANRGGAQ